MEEKHNHSYNPPQTQPINDDGTYAKKDSGGGSSSSDDGFDIDENTLDEFDVDESTLDKFDEQNSLVEGKELAMDTYSKLVNEHKNGDKNLIGSIENAIDNSVDWIKNNFFRLFGGTKIEDSSIHQSHSTVPLNADAFSRLTKKIYIGKFTLNEDSDRSLMYRTETMLHESAHAIDEKTGDGYLYASRSFLSPTYGVTFWDMAKEEIPNAKKALEVFMKPLKDNANKIIDKERANGDYMSFRKVMYEQLSKVNEEAGRICDIVGCGTQTGYYKIPITDVLGIKNTFNFGHPKKYCQDPNSCATEIFANIIALVALDPKATKFLSDNMPKTLKIAQEIMKNGQQKE